LQTKELGLILLIALLAIGLVTASLPYTTSQFIDQTTDLNYEQFKLGVFDGNLIIVDGNLLSIISPNDLNGSGGSGTDTNFETAGMSLNDVNNVWGRSGNDIYNLNSDNVGIGTASPQSFLDVKGSMIRASAGNSYVTLRAEAFSATAITHPALSLRKSHNDTYETNTATIDGETLGRIVVSGVDTEPGWRECSAIKFEQEGDATGYRVPTRMNFLTESGTETMATRMSISPDGNVGIGTDSPDAKTTSCW